MSMSLPPPPALPPSPVTAGTAGREPLTPPLSRWGQIWRLGVTWLIGLIGFVATAAPATTEAGAAAGITLPPTWLLVVDFFVIAPISLVLLWFRRRWPVPVALTLATLGAISMFAGVAAMVALLSVAARRRVREIAVASVWTTAMGLVYELVVMVGASGGTPWWGILIFSVVITAAVIAWGLFLGARRDLRESERQRVLDLEREQGLRMSGARAEERARIAREMHDIVGHRISLISVHAGALAYRPDLDPSVVRAEAEVIQQAATDALAELRQVLGVLRGPMVGETDSGMPGGSSTAGASGGGLAGMGSAGAAGRAAAGAGGRGDSAARTAAHHVGGGDAGSGAGVGLARLRGGSGMPTNDRGFAGGTAGGDVSVVGGSSAGGGVAGAGVAGGHPSGVIERPQPTITDLDELVEEARRSGQLVEFTLDLPGGLPPRELGRHVYRSVQECLTNARKHAPGATVAIRITGTPGAHLITEVVNGPALEVVAAVPSSGLGMVGIGERAAIAGGTLEHGPTPGGGWSVRLVLPWAASATVDR